jgi:hypothetical protein
VASGLLKASDRCSRLCTTEKATTNLGSTAGLPGRFVVQSLSDGSRQWTKHPAGCNKPTFSMSLGHDEFREGLVLSLAAAVALPAARESGHESELTWPLHGEWTELDRVSAVSAPTDSLEVKLRSVVVAQSGRELPPAEVGRIVSLLSSTDMSIGQIAQRMGCCRSTVRTINQIFRVRDYAGRRTTWRSYERDERKVA